MAKYKRRPKVKRYRRSFYSRGMRIRKIVGIVVLVAVVLAAAWFAAPHVLDWATHTWYTVVKDRDLEAESASRAAASSQAAASAAASEAASSQAAVVRIGKKLKVFQSFVIRSKIFIDFFKLCGVTNMHRSFDFFGSLSSVRTVPRYDTNRSLSTQSVFTAGRNLL